VFCRLADDRYVATPPGEKGTTASIKRLGNCFSAAEAPEVKKPLTITSVKKMMRVREFFLCIETPPFAG
jgi:hypothetical protein